MLKLLCCHDPKMEKKDLPVVRFTRALLFNSLPEHLAMTVIRKMEPTGFTRMYRSAKWISTMIDGHSKGPKIDLRGQLVLQFQPDQVKMSLKFQSNLKTFKRTYDFDEVLDSLAKCSLFHIKSIWFPAANFDEDFFYLIMAHIQKKNMKCSTLSVPFNEHLAFAVKTFRPLELCIVGEEALEMEGIGRETLQSIQHIQFDCRTCRDFEGAVSCILPFAANVRIYINNISDFLPNIHSLIKSVQGGSLEMGSLSLEYHQQYNRLFKLPQLASDLLHTFFEIKFPHGSQPVLFFPVAQRDGCFLAVSSKIDRKFAFATDFYEVISFSLITDFPQFVDFVIRAGGLVATQEEIQGNPFIVSIQETLFFKTKE